MGCSMKFSIFCACVLTCSFFFIITKAANCQQQFQAKEMPVITGHAQALQVAVAQVDGQEISAAELMRKMQRITMLQYGSREITSDLSKRIKSEALNSLIDEKLAVRRAMTADISVEPARLKENIQRLKKRLGGEEAFNDYLNKNNRTLADLQVEILNFLAVQQMIRKEVDETINISQEDIQRAYEVNKAKFTQQENVVVDDVIFFLDPDDPATLQKAEKVREKALKKHGGDLTKLTPDGSFVVRDNLVISQKRDLVLYNKQALKLSQNNVSEILNIDGTYHFFKLLEHTPERITPLEEARPVLERELKKKYRTEKLREWKTALRKDAEIEIFDVINSFEIRAD